MHIPVNAKENFSYSHWCVGNLMKSIEALISLETLADIYNTAWGISEKKQVWTNDATYHFSRLKSWGPYTAV